MNVLRSVVVVFWFALGCGACGGTTAPEVQDASTVADATTDAATDANRTDANRTDANVTDAQLTDANVTDAASDAVSCDRRNVACRRAEPICPEGQVAEIIDQCFGECVPIDQCVCTEAADCPYEERFTCHLFRQRCGPYVN